MFIYGLARKNEKSSSRQKVGVDEGSKSTSKWATSATSKSTSN